MTADCRTRIAECGAFYLILAPCPRRIGNGPEQICGWPSGQSVLIGENRWMTFREVGRERRSKTGTRTGADADRRQGCSERR